MQRIFSYGKSIVFDLFLGSQAFFNFQKFTFRKLNVRIYIQYLLTIGLNGKICLGATTKLNVLAFRVEEDSQGLTHLVDRIYSEFGDDASVFIAGRLYFLPDVIMQECHIISFYFHTKVANIFLNLEFITNCFKYGKG